MGRENKHAAAIDRDHWKRVAQRLEVYRAGAKLKQEEMADALGISVRQWRRYVSGERISPEMIRRIAKVFGKPAGKLLMFAGYETDESGLDAEAHLRLMREYVVEGRMSDAIWKFFDFYNLVNWGDEDRPVNAPLLANDFTAAAVAMENMPNWLRRELIMYLLARERGARRGEYPPDTALYEEARTLLRKGLPKAMFFAGMLSVGEYGRSGGSKGGVAGRDGQPGVGGRSHEQSEGGGSDRAARPGGFVPAVVGYPPPSSEAPKKKLTAGVPFEAPPDDLESIVVYAGMLESVLSWNEPGRLAAIESRIASFVRRRGGRPAFAAIGRRLEALKRRHRRGQLAGLELLARLLELAREVAEAEKAIPPREAQEEDQAALTKLLQEVRGDLRPARVSKLVDEIDRGVRFIRFRGWQQNLDGEHEVIKSLNNILRKYKLIQDRELYNRVYEHIKEYY